MSPVADVRNILSGSDELLDVLTGGVLAHKDLPPLNEINRVNYPDMYDTDTLLIKPFGLVKARGLIPTDDLRDSNGQYTSTNQVIEIWLYADRDVGWDNLEAAELIVYGLLHEKPVNGTFNLTLQNVLQEDRDMNQNGTCFMKADYLVRGYRSA